MYITESLIDKFFDNRCTAAEADAVVKYFNEHPDHLKMYLAKEWNETDDTQPLQGVDTGKMLQEIRKATTHRKSSLVVKYRWWAAAAACIIVAAGIWGLESRHPITPSTVAAAQTKDTSIASEWQVRYNDTHNRQQVVLEDGSIVYLSAGSTIRYRHPFINNKRDIWLQGQAGFEVAKDKTRPFTVRAGGISTTALGTYFDVYENAKQVTVKLYRGKIVVRPATDSIKGWKTDIFLLPGQQMKYEIKSSLCTVSKFNTRAEDSVATKESADIKENGNAIVFNHAALPQVIEKLKQYYHTDIIYDQQELSNRYFTGSILTSDSLQTILQVIAQMNGVTVDQNDKGFVISIPHH